MGRASLGSRGLWKLHEDGATGGAHEARKRTGRNAGGGGAGHATAIATLGARRPPPRAERRGGTVYTNVLIVSRD
jgi:hypothetical protein